MADYLVWSARWQDNWCRLGSLENVENRAEIRYGLSRQQGFPSDAYFQMDRDFPYDTLLTDCLKNSSGELVVSAKVTGYLQQANIPHVEYLPVQILDHRDRVVEEEEYSLVNPIHPVECLDVAASVPTWNTIVENQIRWVKQLVIDSNRVPADRALFRCALYTAPKIVHRTLAEGLQSEGFTGCTFTELEAFRG